MRLFAPLLILLSGCQTPPKPKAVAEQEELTALLQDIPAECASTSPLEQVACAPPPPDPEGACVVERFDVRSKRLTDRLVYVGEELVREEQVVSSHTREELTRRYDALHRLTQKTSCFVAGVGEPGWSPPWRPPMAVYDAPMTQATRTTLSYVGDTRTPRFAQTDSSSDRMRYCYAYDAAGRRTRRFQTFRTLAQSTSLQVQVRSYTYLAPAPRPQGQEGPTSPLLSSIDVKSLVLQGRALASRKGWRVDFAYDGAGRLTKYNSSGSTTQFQYDAAGRVVAFGSGALITFDWDEAGRLKGFHPGEPALDGQFEWDATGRISRARFANGEGFEVKYGEHCRAAFSPPPVTPGVEGYLFYEGKDEL